MILACKKISIVVVIFFLFILFPITAYACTYDATITDNHLDFIITSDTDKLAVVQYIRLSGTAIATKMYSPIVGPNWTYFDDFICDIGISTPIACRQNRSGVLGDGAFWQWYNWDNSQYHTLPGGVYGLDFDSPPNYDSIGIEYGVMPGTTSTDNWTFCERIGDIQTASPKLNIIESTINNDGGTDDISNFTINIENNYQVLPSSSASESGTLITLSPGSYNITEATQSGYLTTYSSDCKGFIANGDSKICTITNDDIAPTVTLIKNITNNTEGTGLNDFGMSVGGNTVLSGIPTEVKANEEIVINEAGLTNYNFVSITGENCPVQLGEAVVLPLGQNIVCTITNNYTPPPPPTSITKVFMIPGLGASWNVDALVNCKNTDYSNGWTIAPYAKDIYHPLLSILPTNGWTIIPFYYDWRQNVTTNAPKLNSQINISVQENEKINIVGHSMGGLIGRNYLESQSGGKVLKFLAVGTPNQGSALAYPLVVNKEIWSNNLIEKIAATLQVNHCGVPDSIRNLLPTYNYLRDIKTRQLKDISTMIIKNNYLTPNFVSDFWGVDVGTLAGTGQKTLNIIDVVKNPKWPDGKPQWNEYSSEGDGTVLVTSAQISDASYNEVISQSHSGVIASNEAIDKILEFLGTPEVDTVSKSAISQINSSEYLEHKSALILVGYPGKFSITDKFGFVTESEDGMIAILDPKSGGYNLQITPTSETTTFIVGQFLSNGQIGYKEYKFKGLTQEPKIIEFNSNHTITDPVHENKIKKIPFFYKFWFNPWRFWNIFHK